MFPIRSAVPYRYAPVVTWALIAANCIVFLIQASLGPADLEAFVFAFGLVPARYLELFAGGSGGSRLGDLLPFFTMMFLHGGWLHLIFNMWFLWVFGPAIEDRMGPRRYVVFYLLCGTLASIAHIVANPASTEPAIGASGAIAGVLGCYMRLFPLARVVVVVPIIFIPLFFEIHAFVFVGLWFLIQVLQGTASLALPAAGESVAW
jgi:membrane associated rhomboid family serine protease